MRQRDLIIIATCLMLLIIVPVIVLTLVFAWRYRGSAENTHYNPDWDHSTVLELVIWAAPLPIIITLGAVTQISTHQLDPHRPLTRLNRDRSIPAKTKPLTVEVVAVDWKWLFVYPEQGIATVNELAAPVDRPIAFRIMAITVMNVFLVPSLAGMVCAMPGMETKLHTVISRPGVCDGLSSNYSGVGFSHMRFKFHGLSNDKFSQRVQQVKSSGTSLSKDTCVKLAKPSESEPVQCYASMAPDLYDRTLNRCVDGQACLTDTMAGNRSVKRFDPSAEICTASNTVDVMPIFVPDAVINDGRRLLW